MYVDSEKKHIARKTKNILDILSSLGGLFASLNKIMMIFVSFFSLPMMNAQYAHKLYTWNTPDSFKQEKKGQGNYKP
jgi:hypothetical protein